MDDEYGAYQLRSLYHRTVAEKEEEFVVAALRPKQERVLEVGPGTGRFTRHLAQLAESLAICDISPQVLERVAARFGPQKHVTYRRAGFDELDQLAEYGRFDAAVAVRAAPHAADWRSALKQLFGAVRPGGLVLFDLWNRESFVGLLMKAFPRREPVAVHRLTRREIRACVAALPGEVVATYRWGYPRIGPLHADGIGSLVCPSWAYSTLYCMRKDDCCNAVRLDV